MLFSNFSHEQLVNPTDLNFADFGHVRGITMVSTKTSERSYPRPQPIKYSVNNSRTDSCSLDECFTMFSYCYPFRAYFYTPDDLAKADMHLSDNIQLIPITHALYGGDYRTMDASNACVFVLLLQVLRPGSDSGLSILSSLPNWGGHGRNHIISVTEGLEYLDLNAFRGTSKALLASHAWQTNAGYRHSFDIHIPLLPISVNMPTNIKFPSLSWKKYFLLYPDVDQIKWTGPDIKDLKEQLNSLEKVQDRKTFPMHSFTHTGYEEMVKTLHLLEGDTSSHNLDFVLESDIFKIMNQSHFVLIISSLLDSNQFHFILKEALKAGTVPIIIGGASTLPLDELIEWKRVSITWSIQR